MPCTVYLRLEKGQTVSQAQAEVSALYPAMIDASNAGHDVTPAEVAREKARPVVISSVEHGSMAMRKQFAFAAPVLMGGIILLLLMVSANVSGLMLARAETRAHDVALRLSLGASRLSIMRSALISALCPAAAGGVAGWIIARYCGPLLTTFLPARRPLGIALTPDWRVVAFTAATCIAAALLMSVLPAWRASRIDFAHVMGRGSTRTTTPRAGRVLSAVQIAFATVLVAGSFVLVRTLEALRQQDPGFRRDNLVVMRLNPRMAGVKSPEMPAIFDEVVRRARALPGVTAVAESDGAPMRGVGMVTTVTRPGRQATFQDQFNVSLSGVSTDYFRALGMRILEGRGFEEADRDSKPRQDRSERAIRPPVLSG